MQRCQDAFLTGLVMKSMFHFSFPFFFFFPTFFFFSHSLSLGIQLDIKLSSLFVILPV